MPYILILYFIFYAALSFYRLDWAVMVLIALLPSYLIRFHIFGIPFSLLEGMILISFGAWFFRNWRNLLANLRATVPCGRLWRDRKSQIYRYSFDVEMILLLIISYIAVAIAGFSASALGIWKAYFFEPLLVYILTVNVAFLPSFSSGLAASAAVGEAKASELGLKPGRSGAQLGRIIWPLAISAFVVSAFAVYQKFTGAFIANPFWAAEATRRVTSFFEYPNAVGLFLAPGSMLLAGFLMTLFKKNFQFSIFNFQIKSKSQVSNSGQMANQLADQENKAELRVASYEVRDIFKIIFLSITILFSLLAIYYAKSEGAIVGIAAGLIVFGLLAGKKSRWAVIAMMIVLSAGITAYQPARNKAIEKFTLSDLSGEIRKQQWRETWQMLAESPQRFILGAGLDNYQTAIKPYHQEGIFFNKDKDPDFRRKLVLFDDSYKKKYWQPVEIYMYPHNILLNFWSELGLPGMILFIWLIAHFFIAGIKVIKKKELGIRNLEFGDDIEKYIIIGLMCSMIAIIAHGLVDVPYFKNDLAVLFWLLMAAMGIMKIKSEKNHINHINPC